MFGSWVWSQPPFLLGRHTFSSLPSFFPITATTPDEMVVQCGALSFGQLFLMNHHRKRDSCAEPCCAVNACAAPIMIKSSDSTHSSFLAVFPALFTACGVEIKLLFGWQHKFGTLGGGSETCCFCFWVFAYVADWASTSTVPEAIPFSGNICMDERFPCQCLASHLFSWSHSQLGVAKKVLLPLIAEKLHWTIYRKCLHWRRISGQSREKERSTYRLT